MFINGVKEWIGPSARIFLLSKIFIEQKLLALGYDYFYGGIVSKRPIYDPYAKMLGEHFKDIFIDFKYRDTDYILAPEYTFRVYEYLSRNTFPANYKKVFYSQEMARNESSTDVKDGKTFSFWQIGYEIFGNDDSALSVESITTLWECLHSFPLDGLRLRISDKRILQALCEEYSISDMELHRVLSLLESCNEDGNTFYNLYVQGGGSREFAGILAHLLCLADKNMFTPTVIQDMLKHDLALEAARNLDAICSELRKLCRNSDIVLVPTMPKAWNAYTTVVYDARVNNYDRAVAGGGNLFVDKTNPDLVHSGAGIGVTRIAEYLLATGKDVDASMRLE